MKGRRKGAAVKIAEYSLFYCVSDIVNILFNIVKYCKAILGTAREVVVGSSPTGGAIENFKSLT